MRLIRLIALLALTAALFSATSARAEDPGITIDVPVKLATARIVFNLDHLAFEGDQPTGIQFLKVMTEKFRADGTKADIVAIFHGAAGYLALNDDAYARVRNWPGGNPYKAEIAALMEAGVAFEECGQTMRDLRWKNADLLPGIKVNSGANFRIVELVQDGYVQIQP